MKGLAERTEDFNATLLDYMLYTFSHPVASVWLGLDAGNGHNGKSLSLPLSIFEF